MISLKVLSTAAAMALILPVVVPSESFAQMLPTARGGGAGGAHVGGGGGGAARIGGGGGMPRMGGGAPSPRFSGGGGAPGPRFSGGGGRGYGGGGGYYRHGGDGDRGFIPGAVAGAVIGGALASQSYGYYGGPGYYAPGYEDNGYYDDSGAVAVAPAPGGDDAVAYCMQTYRSYDPQSGTYLGNDGYRHLCP
jgi:hypothetical protein